MANADIFLKQMQSVVEPVIKHLYLHIYVLHIFQKYFPNAVHMLSLIEFMYKHANIIFDRKMVSSSMRWEIIDLEQIYLKIPSKVLYESICFSSICTDEVLLATTLCSTVMVHFFLFQYCILLLQKVDNILQVFSPNYVTNNQRILNDWWRTRIFRCRMIWLLSPFPPIFRQHVASLSLPSFISPLGYRRERGGGGEDLNNTTARNPSPL